MLKGVGFEESQLDSVCITFDKMDKIGAEDVYKRQGVFTNLTRDHLDFHKTMENYLNAKAKLFKISDKGVVNFDDDGGKKIVANNDCDILKVGLSDGCDLKAKNIEISSSGADFDVEYDGKTYRVHIVIPGKLDVYKRQL